MVSRIGLIVLSLVISTSALAKDRKVNKLHDSSSLSCIVRTTIAEGENQSVSAQTGIMYTIHNRSRAWHKGHCTIVNERNQFSHRRIRWNRTFDKLYTLADNVVHGRVADVTGGALFFHDKSLRRNPFNNTKFTARHDDMFFYKGRKRLT